MKRSTKRLLIALGLVLAVLGSWFGSPRLRAAAYELGFRLGPDSTRGWCIDRLEALGAEGAPSLVSLLENAPEDEVELALMERVGEILRREAPESLPALGMGLRDRVPLVRVLSAYLIVEIMMDRVRDKRQPRPDVEYSLRDTTVPFRNDEETAPLGLDQEQSRAFVALVPALLHNLDDPDPTLRGLCLAALARLPGSSAALPAAAKSVRLAEGPLRFHARSLVLSLGPEACPELERLLASLLDELEARPSPSAEERREAASPFIFDEPDELEEAIGWILRRLAEHKTGRIELLNRARARPEDVVREAAMTAFKGRGEGER